MDKPKRVICFNGPPGVGKDTAANAVAKHVKDTYVGKYTKCMSMADPLKSAVHALFGTFHSYHYYNHEPNGRKLKEEPHELMFGMSPRQAYIGMSEQALKPWLGSDIFGRIACNKMHNSKDDLFVFSDGGFVDEWVPVIDYVGIDNFRLVELHSPQCTFDGDSRTHIGEALKTVYPTLQVTRIVNNKTTDPFDKELFLMMCKGVVDKMMGE